MTIDYEHGELADCEKTVHMHGRVVPARRTSPHLRSMEGELVSQYLENETTFFASRNCRSSAQGALLRQLGPHAVHVAHVYRCYL